MGSKPLTDILPRCLEKREERREENVNLMSHLGTVLNINDWCLTLKSVGFDWFY